MTYASPPEVSGASRDRETRARLPVPTRTVPLLLLLFVAGALVLAFTLLTVNRRASEEFASNMMAKRMHFSITYWMEHGLLRSGAVPARTSDTDPVYFHRSSTAGRLVGGYFVEKVYSAFTGEYGWRVLAVYNQLVVAAVATLLALLAFRLARRAGATPWHALLLSLSFQAVFFTFPDNLALFWGTTGREYWLLFAAIFLLVEERSLEARTRTLTHVQGLSVFLLTYMEIVAGVGFIVAYGVVTVLLGANRATLKRVAMVCVVPALCAIALHRGQLFYVDAMFPSIPQVGTSFMSRTGLDGATTYYIDHLDIAFGRDLARQLFPPNGALLFDWMWFFLAGTVAVLGIFIAALRGRVDRAGVITLSSLLGAYVLTAALFSQAVVIHPYLYDVMLFTPLSLALLVVMPALAESMSRHRGVVVSLVFLIAICVSIVQLRQYALRYPLPPPSAREHQVIAVLHVLLPGWPGGHATAHRFPQSAGAPEDAAKLVGT